MCLGIKEFAVGCGCRTTEAQTLQCEKATHRPAITSSPGLTFQRWESLTLFRLLSHFTEEFSPRSSLDSQSPVTPPSSTPWREPIHGVLRHFPGLSPGPCTIHLCVLQSGHQLQGAVPLPQPLLYPPLSREHLALLTPPASKTELLGTWRPSNRNSLCPSPWCLKARASLGMSVD